MFLSRKILGRQLDRIAMLGAAGGNVPGIAVALEHCLAGKALRGDDPFQRRKPVTVVGLAGIGVPCGLCALDLLGERCCRVCVVGCMFFARTASPTLNNAGAIAGRPYEPRLRETSSALNGARFSGFGGWRE